MTILKYILCNQKVKFYSAEFLYTFHSLPIIWKLNPNIKEMTFLLLTGSNTLTVFYFNNSYGKHKEQFYLSSYFIN